MEELKNKINQIKAGFTKKEEASRNINKFVADTLNKVTNENKTAGNLTAFNFYNGKLTLETKNKTEANELFYKKDQLENQLSQNKLIKRVIIK